MKVENQQGRGVIQYFAESVTYIIIYPLGGNVCVLTASAFLLSERRFIPFSLELLS